MAHRPRLAAAGLALVALASVSACSTETVATGERPHQPASASVAPRTPTADPAPLRLTDLPGYTPPRAGEEHSFTRNMTEGPGEFGWSVVDAEGRPTAYAPGPEVVFGDPETYNHIPGVLTFRGNNHRTGGTWGTAQVTDQQLEVVWTKEIGEIRGEGSYWPGAGWTGQPLLVQWPRETKVAMGLADEFVNDDAFVEVIYPVFEGKIHRLDLKTGRPTRDPIEVGWGFKGTASVDPRGYPLLYAGQGLNDTNGTIGPWRYRVFDLIQNKEVWHISGLDPAAPRHDWGAFDSSALVDAETDTLFAPAENGLIYKVALNSSYDAAAKTVAIEPEVTRLRYTAPGNEKYGIENSAVGYRNLMFAADNEGKLFSWDATTLEMLWMREVEDDTDASLVLEETPEGVFLYTGNEVDTRKKATGDLVTNIRKIDALTGKQVWQYDIPAYYTGINGGVLATPVLGKGAIADLVIFNVSRTTAPREGDLIALNKADGSVAWRRHLSNYSWSSPLLITGTDGTLYGVLADSDGVVHLFDPATGEDLSTISLGKNVEATPAAFGDMLVVASYDRKIHGIRIR
ncbi:MAG: PQQ-binding-like beta-propeller repeat protein [Propionibacteriaceae bacterium]|nr:PQQ-binding-like beta-propeller repeat protein [Propionibacteriaceae bacterium]